MPICFIAPLSLAASFAWAAPGQAHDVDVESMWAAQEQVASPAETWSPDLDFLGPLAPVAESLTSRGVSSVEREAPTAPSIGDPNHVWLDDLCGPPRAGSGLKLVARYTLEF